MRVLGSGRQGRYVDLSTAVIALPLPGDNWEASEVVVLDLGEALLFIDNLRAIVDAHERLIRDACSWMPHERKFIPPVLPADFFD